MKKILLVICMVIVLIAIGYGLARKQNSPTTETPRVVFSSIEECQQKTGKACDFLMCDYVPPGKTFEEVCGKDFKKGWVPVPPVQ